MVALYGGRRKKVRPALGRCKRLRDVWNGAHCRGGDGMPCVVMREGAQDHNEEREEEEREEV
jgi:hypothetical protein